MSTMTQPARSLAEGAADPQIDMAADMAPDVTPDATALDADHRARRRLALAMLALITIAAAAGLVTGTRGFSPTAFWADLHGDQAALIVGQIRAPRTLGAAFVGALLGLGGALAQGLFRNPLADPYLIGVAAGAGLGAIIAMLVQAAYPGLGLLLVPLGAFAGALGTVALVYALGQVGRSTPVTTLVLAGVAVGALATACSTLLLLRVGRQAVRVLAFLLGGYSSAGWGAVLTVAPFTLVGFALMYMYARQLNLLLLDAEQAQQLGVHVQRVTLIVVGAATLTTAAAVAFSGLIGFVGLIVPHTARLLVGADHRRLLPLATLGGAGFLLLADLLARTVIAPEELPLGVITAFVGAPFFLWLLRNARRGTAMS